MYLAGAPQVEVLLGLRVEERALLQAEVVQHHADLDRQRVSVVDLEKDRACFDNRSRQPVKVIMFFNVV